MVMLHDLFYLQNDSVKCHSISVVYNSLLPVKILLADSPNVLMRLNC